MLTTSKTFLKFVVGVKYDWLEELFERRSKMDLNKVVGKDVKDLIKDLVEAQQSKEEKPEKRQHEEQQQTLQLPKMDKKNDEQSIQAARDRYLQRKQQKK
jgi:hypothetical protein